MKRGRALVIALAVCLCGLGCAYVALGLYRLAFHPAHPFAADLHLRWNEMRALLQGVAPATVYETADYPPWAYGWGLLLVPPFLSWPAVRVYFAVLNAVSAAALALWAYRSGRRCGDTAGMIAGGAVLSMVSTLYCLSNGQYSLIVTVALVLMLECMKKNMQLLAGLLASLAFIKPHLAALFLLVPLVRKQWAVLASFLAFTLAFALPAWIMTGETPVALLGHMLHKSQGFAVQGQGLASVLALLGMGHFSATLLLMATGLAAASVLLWINRGRAPLLLFAAAAVISMLWSYHKAYDASVMAFLVVLLAGSKSRAATGFLAATIVMIALPFRMKDHNTIWLQLLSAFVWIGALAAGLKNSKEDAGEERSRAVQQSGQ